MNYIFLKCLTSATIPRSNRVSEYTHENMRSAAAFIHLYRTLQVQHAVFHRCFRYMFLTSNKAMFSAVAVLGMYGAIKIPGPRAISMGGVAVTILLYFKTFFNTLANLHTASQRLLESRKGGDRYMRKVTRSCRPLSVYLGGYYYVSHTTVLVLCGVIVNATITLLLT